MATLTVTDKAISEVKTIMADQNMNPETTFLRVAVKGGGCSGFQYSLNLDESFDESKDSKEDLADGIKLVVDKRSAMYLQGVTLDFHDALDKRGFKFDNPNATGRCGCGSSFSL